MNPNIAGFTQYVYQKMGISSSILPANSPFIAAAYQDALDVVSDFLAVASPNAYAQAVYALAAHNLMVEAQDTAVLLSTIQASVSGTTLNVSAFNSSSAMILDLLILDVSAFNSTNTGIQIGALVSDNVTMYGVKILQQLDGTPLGIGNYQIDGSYQIASENMTVSTPPNVYQKGLAYFEYWRAQWGINTFTAGVVESTSDEGSSVSLHVPEFMDNLPMSALEYLKTPFGRTYLNHAQRVGGDMGMS